MGSTEVCQESTFSVEMQHCLSNGDWNVHIYKRGVIILQLRCLWGPASQGETGTFHVQKKYALKKKKNHRSGKWVVRVKIHFSLFVLLILAVICSLFLLEAAFPSSCLVAAFEFLSFESLPIWTQNGSPVAKRGRLSDRVRSNLMLRNFRWK